MKRNIHYLFFILICTATLPACAGPLKYSADPIEAWVMDAETKQPLENVIVVAHWELETTSRIVPHQTNSAGSLMILETVTDKNGRFYFPAWGPKWHLGTGNLTDSDPELILFKSGYKYLRVSNSRYLRPSKYSDVGKPSGTESKPTGSKRISFWSGERVGLEKFKGTIQAYEDHFESLNDDLEHIAADNPEECGWKKIPDTIRAMNRERMRLIAQGINPNTLSSIDKRLLMNDEYFIKKGGCGSPRVFFRELQQ
jgi:hypothetical protein